MTPQSDIITIGNVALPLSVAQRVYDKLASRNGSLGIWDAKNPRSWASQAAPTALNYTLKNLLAGGANADVSTDFTWGTNGGFVRSAVAGSRIALGVYDFGNHAIAGLLHVKIPTVPTAYTPLLSRLNTTSAGVDNQFGLAIGADGKVRLDLIHVDADNVTTRVLPTYAPAVITTGVHQIGFHARMTGPNATEQAIYIDGVQVAISTYIGAKLNPSTLGIAVGNRHATGTGGATAVGQTYYRTALEDLTLSGKTGADFIATDWQEFSGKFS